jgi:hypothetical protein
MWCMKCQQDVVECDCPDIDDRLEGLYDTGMGLAARQNREERKVLWDTIIIDKNSH